MSDDKKSMSIWNKDVGELAQELKQDALDKLFHLSSYIQNRERVSLEELIDQYYSINNLDQFILEIERNEDISFVGGIFTIELQSITLMKISVNFYFKNNITDEYILKKGTQDNMEMNLYLDDSSIEKLIHYKKFEFDIESPN